MKLIVFDVGNAACSVVASPSNIGMMIDCGSNSDKDNPVDLYLNQKKWLGIVPYVTAQATSFELGLLHITHPDDDHVRNAKRIKEEMAPYLLMRRRFEEFPDSETINSDYKKYIDNHYRGNNPEKIHWGFEVNKIFQIPMDTIKSDELLSKKVRNNSSILRFIKHKGISVLFAGELEKDGWQWLADNNRDFVSTISSGVDILVAPHHGHKSGFPKALFELSGDVGLVIHSKGSEGNIDGTDVSTQYSSNSLGINYKNLVDNSFYSAKVLTTRSNGNIYIQITSDGYEVWAGKASSNHTKVE